MLPVAFVPLCEGVKTEIGDVVDEMIGRGAPLKTIGVSARVCAPLSHGHAATYA